MDIGRYRYLPREREMIVNVPTTIIVFKEDRSQYQSPTENEWSVIEVGRLETRELTPEMMDDLERFYCSGLPMTFASADLAYVYAHLKFPDGHKAFAVVAT